MEVGTEDQIKIEIKDKTEIIDECLAEKAKILSILMGICGNKDSKEKKNSISKENYMVITDFINKADEHVLIQFFDFLNDINLPILKQLIKDYFKIDFKENENNSVLQQFKKLFKIYFSKRLFKCVYKQLSKIFRKNYQLKDIDGIKKFEKVFNLWKLLYNMENNQGRWLGLNYNKDADFEINIKKEEFTNGKNEFIIKIYFTSSEILNKMIKYNGFYFVQFHEKEGESLVFSYLNNFDIVKAKKAIIENETNIMEIQLFSNKYVSVTINEHGVLTGIHALKNISKITISNYFFYSEISQINIQIKNEKRKIPLFLEAELKKEKYSDKFQPKFVLGNKNEELRNNIDYKKYIEFFKIRFNKNREWHKIFVRLEEIYAICGIENFIPLFKIIKYIMDNLGNKSDQESGDYLNKSIIWVKDIIKIILRLITLNEKNYINFTKCIIPLMGAFAEILNTFNKLIKSHKISKDQKNSLFKDEVIYSLFIAIIYARPSRNVIERYLEIFEIEKIWNFNFSMDYLFFGINNVDSLYFEWYFSIMFSLALFILIYNDSSKYSKNIIENINKIMSDKNRKEIKLLSFYISTVKPFINFITELYNNPEKKNYSFNCTEEELKTNKNMFQLLICLIKAMLNAQYLIEIRNINDTKRDIFINLFTLLNRYKIKINKEEEKYQQIYQIFRMFGKDITKVNIYFDLTDDLRYVEEPDTNELIDYHGQYHKVMKELFSFNRFWSKEKLFCDEFNKRSKNVKYKVINYYTRNFQRPIVYPVLDYKYRNLEFSFYKMSDKFYKTDSDEKKEKKSKKMIIISI